jgi:hypothetical protein
MGHFQKSLYVTSVLLIAFILTACGGGGGGDDGSDDTGGSDGSGSVVSYTVSTAVGAGGAVTPSFASVDEGSSASFTIAPNSGYSIEKAEGCGGSLTGSIYSTGPILSDCSVSVSFTLISVDNTPPTVLAMTPANGAKDVDRNASISITFSEDMLASSINTNNIYLSQSGTLVSANMNFDGHRIVTITPVNPLAINSDYIVKVTMGAKDIIGNSLSADFQSAFTTKGREWKAPQLLENDDTGRATAPSMVVDVNGNAVVTWRYDSDSQIKIWGRSFLKESGWEAPELIASMDGEYRYIDEMVPQMKMSPVDGNVLAVWFQSDGTRYNIWSSNYGVTSGWGSPELVEHEDIGDATAPVLAMDSGGNALVMWPQTNGSLLLPNEFIWANYYSPSSGWGNASKFHGEFDGAGVFDYELLMDREGNGIAIWQGNGRSLWSNRFVPSLGWEGAKLIELEIDSVDISMLAMDDNGNAIATWSQFDGSSNNIWYNRYEKGSDWNGALLIDNNNSSYSSNPRVVFDRQGNGLGVWEKHDGTGTNIWASYYTPAEGWGASEIIESDNTRQSFYPNIIFNSGGGALVVWLQLESSGETLWSNHFSPNGGWGSAEIIDGVNGEKTNFFVKTDYAGDVYVAWSQLEGEAERVCIKQYSWISGWGETKVVDNSAGDLFGLRLEFDPEGNAFAVWMRHDGERYNLWYSRYE